MSNFNNKQRNYSIIPIHCKEIYVIPYPVYDSFPLTQENYPKVTK